MIDLTQSLQVPTGDQIRAARKAAGLSQGQLAAALGLPRYQTWQEYERGAYPIPVHLWALALLTLGQHPTASAAVKRRRA